ncbi:MAG: PfkB family carbohydrate kinase [Puniceicoccales bacterium]|jgi:D-beta-D-heptose 7-phosphate kinase/D-beta-D-heptose 1-phosphate adenosyltransferase|nr:PfkB family carbohydrate kinase [Puniceicoccales bacterium]
MQTLLQSILNKASGLRVLVFGDVMLDHYVIGDVYRLSPEAPVPVVLAREDVWMLGGAANVARNLASIGVMAEVAGLVGKDSMGDRLQNLLTESNILFDSAFHDSSVSTICKTRIVAGRQQICRVDRERSVETYAVTKNGHLDLIEKALDGADVLILSDYAKGTLTQSVINRIIKAAKAKSCFVAADPKPNRPLQYAGADLLTPNAFEAMTMAGYDPHGTPDWQSVCKKIYTKHAAKNLVITLGAEGMLIARDGQMSKKVPTSAREVFDVSGAGDTVIAALSVALASGHTLEEAVHFANVAAGIVVGKLGTAVATPAEILNSVRQGSEQ